MPETPGEPSLRQSARASQSCADHLNNRIFFRVFQVANVLQRQAVRQLGVTTVQWAVLGACRRGSSAPACRGRPGRVPGGQPAEPNGVLKRLKRDRLVERVAGTDDRRARVVRLTPKGRVFWDDLLLRIYQFYDKAAARFSFDERVALAHYLNELQKDLSSVELPEPGPEKRRAR